MQKWCLCRLRQFQGDVIAGIAVGLTAVPQSLAYAKIAELPPQVCCRRACCIQVPFAGAEFFLLNCCCVFNKSLSAVCLSVCAYSCVCGCKSRVLCYEQFHSLMLVTIIPFFVHVKVQVSSGVLGGYTRVYGVYQPPGFFDSVYSPQ